MKKPYETKAQKRAWKRVIAIADEYLRMKMQVRATRIRLQGAINIAAKRDGVAVWPLHPAKFF